MIFSCSPVSMGAWVSKASVPSLCLTNEVLWFSFQSKNGDTLSDSNAGESLQFKSGN